MRYKTPWHVRSYVKKELMDYESNKRLLKRYRGDTRGLILITNRLSQIEKVFSSLNEADRDAAETIFIKHISREAAEKQGIGRAAFYNAMNKVIYLTAREMDLI